MQDLRVSVPRVDVQPARCSAHCKRGVCRAAVACVLGIQRCVVLGAAGRLTRAQKVKGIENFSAGKIRLPELAIETWGPLVFVNVQPRAADGSPLPTDLAVQQQMADAASVLEANGGWEGGEVPWRSLKHLRRRIYTLESNWKVYMDNYLVSVALRECVRPRGHDTVTSGVDGAVMLRAMV